ncbi:MAG: cytochrome C [Opitutales bacterium]
MKTPELDSQAHSCGAGNGRPARALSRWTWPALLVAAGLALTAPRAQALPSFARQMDLQCTACHTEYPMLNQFGRTFKLTGYTTSAEDSNLPPLAVMLMPSFTHTSAGQAGGAAPGFNDNNNYAMTQASVFYAGRLFGPYAKDLFGPDVAAFLNKFGIFSQMTYDGVAKTWSWDNTELRFAGTTEVGETDVIYGAYWNNNPGLQDPWNSSPAFSFPFSGSGLAPTPAASTLIEGGLAQQVGGVGFYTLIANSLYLDVAGYQSLATKTQSALGVDPTGETQLSGTAPYWRLAYEKAVGDGRWEIGTFGLAASTYPGRDQSAGTDKFTDIGFDTQYQLSTSTGDIGVMASWINEHQKWGASQALGNTDNSSDSLNSYKLTGTYLYDKTYGVTVQYFDVTGGADATLYGGSATGSPNSDGFVFQLDYLPLNKNGGPAFWPRSNVKFSLQYVAYNRFDGARTNYDGAGTNASANNTLYLEAWIVF